MKSRSPRQVARNSVLHFFILAGFAFQLLGCSPDSETLPNDTDYFKFAAANSSGGGNGDYYGGKPEPGTYSRQAGLDPCPDAPINVEQIHITESRATLVRRDLQTCRMVRSDVALEELEFASYEPGRVGHFDGIYVKSGRSQNDGIVEAWCRREGSTSSVGYDVIVRADYARGKFAAKVSESRYLADRTVNHREFQLENLDREVSADRRIRYRTNDFDMEVDTTSFNGVTGKFRASLKFDSSGINVATEISCRLSGTLDPLNTRRGRRSL